MLGAANLLVSKMQTCTVAGVTCSLTEKAFTLESSDISLIAR